MHDLRPEVWQMLQERQRALLRGHYRGEGDTQRAKAANAEPFAARVRGGKMRGSCLWM